MKLCSCGESLASAISRMRSVVTSYREGRRLRAAAAAAALPPLMGIGLEWAERLEEEEDDEDEDDCVGTEAVEQDEEDAAIVRAIVGEVEWALITNSRPEDAL